MKSRWSTDVKIRIELQTFSPQTSMAETCREHNPVPRTVYGWKEKFLVGGHSSLEGPDASKQAQRHKKEITPLKSINGEYSVANNALKKKRWRASEDDCRTCGAGDGGPQQGAPALRGVQEGMVLHPPGPRNVSPDPEVQEMIQKIGPARPTYGTRRMAAQVSRELNRPVNRRMIRCIFERLGWSKPSRTKREIIRANKKPPRPKAPNQFWEYDMSYIWCGSDGQGYCINVIDVFTRQGRRSCWPAAPRAARPSCR